MTLTKFLKLEVEQKQKEKKADCRKKTGKKCGDTKWDQDKGRNKIIFRYLPMIEQEKKHRTEEPEEHKPEGDPMSKDKRRP